MLKRIGFTTLVVLVPAGAVAIASGATVSVGLSPNKVAKASSVSITATGPFGFSGLPSSAELLVQKGFKSSAKSVKVLCSASQAAANQCPSKSRIGSGMALATGTFGALSEQDTVNFTLFLGKRVRPGDIASVVLIGTDTLLHETASATGRLFIPAQRGLELLFSPLPTFQLPPGTTVTLHKLTLKAGARRTAGRKRYSLITNPRTCNGQWTGSFTATFPSGTFSKPLTATCRS